MRYVHGLHPLRSGHASNARRQLRSPNGHLVVGSEFRSTKKGETEDSIETSFGPHSAFSAKPRASPSTWKGMATSLEGPFSPAPRSMSIDRGGAGGAPPCEAGPAPSSSPA